MDNKTGNLFSVSWTHHFSKGRDAGLFQAQFSKVIARRISVDYRICTYNKVSGHLMFDGEEATTWHFFALLPPRKCSGHWFLRLVWSSTVRPPLDSTKRWQRWMKYTPLSQLLFEYLSLGSKHTIVWVKVLCRRSSWMWLLSNRLWILRERWGSSR